MIIDGEEFINSKGNYEYIKPKDLPSNGKYKVGKYLDTSIDSYGYPQYRFQEDSGNFFVVNNCGSLARAMKEVPHGTKVALTYAGEKVLEKGKFKGKKFHCVDVFIVKPKEIQAVETKDLTKIPDSDADSIPF